MKTYLRMLVLSVFLVFSPTVILPMDPPHELSIGAFAELPKELFIPFLITLDPAAKNRLSKTNHNLNNLLSLKNPNPFLLCKELNACEKDFLKLTFPGVYANDQKIINMVQERYNIQSYTIKTHCDKSIEALKADFPSLKDKTICPSLFLVACMFSKSKPIEKIVGEMTKSLLEVTLSSLAEGEDECWLHIIIHNGYQNVLEKVLESNNINKLLQNNIEELVQLAIFNGQKNVLKGLLQMYKMSLIRNRGKDIVTKGHIQNNCVDYIGTWTSSETLKESDNLSVVLKKNNDILIAKHEKSGTVDDYCDCLKMVLGKEAAKKLIRESEESKKQKTKKKQKTEIKEKKSEKKFWKRK